MPGWTLVHTHPTQGRTFQRPVSTLELGFLWDGFFNGSRDCLHHYELSPSNGPQDAHLFSETNIIRAWMSTKRRYPLAGAAVRNVDGGPLQLKIPTDSNVNVGTGFESDPYFVVQEHNFTVFRSHEIVFGSIASAEDARRQAVAILHGPRALSDELLAKLYVFRETDPERGNCLHLMILLVHCVTDAIANRSFARCLLDTLARGDESEPAQIPLEERLAMVIPSMDLEPEYLRLLSPAIRRWRRAVGIVILQLRTARMQGGHTLPWRRTHSTPLVAARSGLVSTLLTQMQTTTVISNCHMHNITFGNALPAIAQVAMTRLLYRRYLHGEISEEEWAYRQKQPYINLGPLNLRPYLDRAWFDKGGGGELVPSVGSFFLQLPFISLGTTPGRQQQVLSNGVPPFSDLLTFDWFLHRVMLAKKQMRSFLSHPLVLEIARAKHLEYAEHARLRTLQWMQHVRTGAHGNPGEDKVLAPMDIPMVWHGGSSVGDMNLITPTEYPLPPSHPLSPYSSVPHPVKAGYLTTSLTSSQGSQGDTTPRITVENLMTLLHASPGELYLGSATSHGRMSVYIYYDENVFEEAVVKEWLDEVREAVLWYLGQTIPPRHTEQSDGRTRLGQRVHAKL